MPSRRFSVPSLFLTFTLAAPLPLAVLATAGCGSPTIHATMDDATITARVKTQLLNDPQISATKIDVGTTNGVVSLSGTVKSKADEQRAVEVARQVSGVKDVRSSLQVNPGS